MHITMETKQQSSAFKMAVKISVPRHKEVHWLHHRCFMGEHKSVLCH